MISSKVKESEHFKAILQFIDWLYYSDEGQEFTKWGVEGVTYTKEGGVRKLMDDINYNGLNPKGTKDLRIEHGSRAAYLRTAARRSASIHVQRGRAQFQKSMSETKPS